MVLVRIFTIFLLFLFGSSILVFGQTPQRIYVNVSAVDTINANGSLNLPYHRIQLAINNAVKGDSIFVSKGRYLENINFLGKEIFVSSNYFFSKDTTDISQTIIDGNNKDIAVKFQSNETRKSVLYGFNVTNGWAGISIANCSPTLDYLILEGNRSVYDRGSAIIASDNCSFLLDHSTIRNHTGGNGIISIGNIHSDSAYTIRNSIFHNNICQNTVVISDGRGGGIFENNLFYNHTVPAIGFINTQNGIKIINTTIVSNGAESVRHLYNNIYQSNVIIVNSILNSENTSLQIGMNNPIPSTFFVIKNSFVKGGAQAISRLQTTTLEDSSTIFSDVSQIQNFVQNNFRLQNSSSLIGSGISSFIFNSQEIKSPISDILGNSRPNPTGSSPDLGAYESPFKHPSPVVISAEGGDKSVRLRWTQAPGSRLARYKVFRSTNPIPDISTAGVIADTISVSRLEYLDATGLTNLTRYYYRMKTVDSSGIESGISNEVSVIPNIPPAVPDSFFVEAGPYSASLKWAKPLNTKYKFTVFRSINGGAIQRIADTIALLTFTDSNLVIGSQYSYAVATIDEFGVKSDTSAFIKITPNKIYFISPNGNNMNSGSINSPKQSITLTSNLARIGDTIILKRGVYKEAINLSGKVKLISSMHIFTNDSTDIFETRLSGINNGNSNLISINSNLENDVFVNAVTIEDVRLQVVYLGYPSVYTFRLRNSIIDNCGTYGQWGVIALTPNGVLENSIIKRNKGRYIISLFGGEVRNCFFFENSTSPLGNIYDDASIIHIDGGKAKVVNNVLYRNLANAIDFGGNGADSMFIINNTVVLNSGYGIKFQTWGGVYSGFVVNNISRYNKLNDIYANVVTNGPGVYLKNNFFGLSGHLYTTNLLSPNNTLLDTTGNIGGDPFFIDTLNNDFRLKPYSPAIGRGINFPYLYPRDILGQPRVNVLRATPDMGAFENNFRHPSPILTLLEGGDRSVRLNWTQAAATKIARFKVFRSTSPIPDNATGGVITDTISITRLEYLDVTGLTNLTRYYYRMKTVDSSGIESGMSNEVSVVPNTLSSKVSSVRVSSSSRLVGVRWTAVSGYKYNVYRGTERGLFNLVAREISDSAYLDSSVIKNQRYYYNVRSVDSVGVPGVPSDTLEISASGYFYVSPEGSDLNGGSSTNPFKTINRALKLAQSTDTIILKAGVHRERLNIRHTQRPLTIGSEYILSGDTSLISKTVLDGSTVNSSPLIYDSTVVYGNTNNLYNQLIGFTVTGSRGMGMDGTNRWNVKRMQFVGNMSNGYLLHNINRLNVDSSLFERNGSENNATGLIYIRDSGSLRNTIIRNNQLEGHAFVSEGGNFGDSVVVAGNIFTRTRHRYYWSHQLMVHSVNTYNFIFRDNIASNNDGVATIYVYTADRTDCLQNIYNNTIINNNTRNGGWGALLVSSRAQSAINIYNNIIQGNISNETRLQMHINPEGGSANGGKLSILNNVIGSDSITAKINNLSQLNVVRNTGNSFNVVNFVDSARGNYRLQNWSWGIGMGYAGNDLPKSARDYAGSMRPNPIGSAPDLGAHENPLSLPSPFIDNVQRSGDSIYIPWSFFDRSLIDSVIIIRSLDTNIESSVFQRKAIKFNSNQLVIRDTLSSNIVHYYGIFIRMINGYYTNLSNIKPSNALSKKASFLPQMVNPRFVWGDIDSDGDLDLAVMGETPGIFFQLYRNNSGVFTEVFNRSQVPQLFKGTMKFADIDNDGDIDLIASGQKTVAINNLGTFLFKNDGAGNFSFNEIIDVVSTREGDMAFGDHDNDGDLDMALSGIDVNGLSRLTVYNNNGKGTFSIERRLFPSQGGPSDPLYSDLQWVDYDNDGDQDLVFSGRASGASAGIVTNTLFNNNQTNNFSGSNIRYYNEWALRNAALETADINADGWVDIIVSGNLENGSLLNRQTRIIYGSQNGFQIASWLPLDNIAGQVRVADFDNDGDLDILVSGLDQQASPKTVFYLNTGTGSGFEKKSYEIIPNLDRSAFSWADYDNDGDLDLVISGQKPASQGGQVISEIYTFEPEKKNASPSKPAKPLIQNFGDGRIIVSWASGKDDLTPSTSLNYLLKIGTVSLTGIPAQSYTVIESNKNGGTLLNPETGLIYGTNYFTQLNPGRYYFLLQVVDHNKLTSQPSDTLFLTLAYPWKFVNQGGIADATITPNAQLSAKWGDIDRDNDYDFLYGSGLYESNKNNYAQSNYQFDEGYLFNPGGGQSLVKPNIKWHDVTQDGVADLIVTSTESINPSNATFTKFRLNIFKNDPRLSETGRGRLSRLGLGAEDSIFLGNTRFKVTDLNNDGKPDILLAGVDKTTQSKVHVFTTGPLSTDKTSPPGFKFSRLNTNLDSLLLSQASYDLEFDFGDVDGDSDNDFVAFFKNELGDLISKTYLNTGINLSTGKINFVQSSTYTFETLDRPSIDLLDYDKDGDLDLLTSGRSFASGQQFNIYESRNGTFVKIINPIQSFENAKLSFGDINNDGYSDLIYTGTREGSGIVSKIAVFNPTTKGFEEQSQFLFGEEFSDLNIEFGDFDADSDLDILVNGVLSGSNPKDLFRVYKNVQNESARLLKALGTNTNVTSQLNYQENIKLESSGEKSFGNILTEAIVGDNFTENLSPSTPINLNEQIISRVGEVIKVRFSWDAATDDNTPAEGLSYDLRVGTASGISDAVVSLSLPNGYRMVPEEGNTGRKRVWDIDLKPGTYYWSTQSIDASFSGSPFAEERRFTIDASGQICDISVPILTYNRPLNFCEGDSVVLVAERKQGIQWFKNDVLIDNAIDSLLKVFSTGSYKVRYVNAACSSSFSNPVSVNVNARPTAGKIDASATEVCLGTPVSLTASLDSVYQWFRNDSIMTGVFNQKITVNQSGTYTFISKFNGCTSPKSSPISIVVSPVPTASFTMSSSSICEGTKVTLNAVSGTAYAYQWMRNGVNIAGATASTYTTGDAGRYSLLVSLNKCSAVSSADSLSVTPIPVAGTINASATTVCEGTSITLNASSDSAYQWFRNDNLLTSITGKTITTKESGTYSFNIRINGCVSPKSAVLNATVNPVPIATFTMSSSAICEGSKVTLTASTGTGYNYQWLKNGVNISGATSSTYAAGETGRYAVLVSSNGCNATSTSDSLTVTTIPSKPTISKDGTELVSSSAAGNLWYAEGNLISGANQQRYKPTNNGNYSARVRTNGCESVMSETYYFLVTGLVELDNDQYIKAYPNPLTNGQDLVIDWRLGGINTTMKAEVFDPNGKKVADKVLTKNNNRLKINGGSGLYFIQLSWGDSKRQTIRVIKN